MVYINVFFSYIRRFVTRLRSQSSGLVLVRPWTLRTKPRYETAYIAEKHVNILYHAPFGGCTELARGGVEDRLLVFYIPGNCIIFGPKYEFDITSGLVLVRPWTLRTKPRYETAYIAEKHVNIYHAPFGGVQNWPGEGLEDRLLVFYIPGNCIIFVPKYEFDITSGLVLVRPWTLRTKPRYETAYIAEKHVNIYHAPFGGVQNWPREG